MIRVVIAVCLTVAIVGVGLQGVETLQETRSVTTVTEDVLAVDRAAEGMLRTDDRPPGESARRVRSVTLPGASMTTAQVDRLVFTPERVSLEIAGQQTVILRPETPYRVPNGSLILEDPGTHDLWLSLKTDGTNRTIEVSRHPPSHDP